MKGLNILKKYYSNDIQQACTTLLSFQHLHDLLEDNCLVIFLRYLENMQHMEELIVVKTLLLAVRLAKIDNNRIRKLFPHKYLELETERRPNKSFDEELVGFVLQNLHNYLNFLLREHHDEHEADQQEMQIVTKNLNELKKCHYSKNAEVTKYCEMVYWLAEEAVFQLWLKVDKQLLALHLLQDKSFQAFYHQYTTFCTYRRKIPTIRHRQLKSVDVTHEANQRVEQRKRQIANSKDQRQAPWSFTLKGLQHVLKFSKINANDF